MMNIAVITGASKGIGLAIVKELLPYYEIINVSRSNGIDVSNPNQIRELFKDISPSVLINCAGFVEPKGILEISDEEWYQTINTNLSGTFFCTREFVKKAKNTGGKIINIASTAGTRAQPGWCAYAASKAAIINFSLTMAEELKQYNIKVYCISPGRCATELRRKLAPEEDQSKIMQPEEVALLVKDLILGNDPIDGQNIIVRR